MVPQAWMADWLRSTRTQLVLAVIGPVGMLALSGLMLLDLRRDAWDKVEQTSLNLLQVIERDIARNVEIFDLSLQGAVENLRAPGIDELSPAMRHLILFDRATTARYMGVMLVIDERGDIVYDAGAVPPRKGNYADREYFRAHRDRPDLGLHVGPPLVSRLTGERMLPFSRRVEKPDGSFGGVALGTLKLEYFRHLFARIDLGREGAINLFSRDGTRIMRHPYEESDIGANLAGAPTFDRFASEPSGSFVGSSVKDGVERFYAFTQVGTLPLILNIALSTREIEAEWRTKALVIGGVTVVLCGLTVFLSLLFGRELRRRAAMQAELGRLARTDGLTGLANRRCFEQVSERVWRDARRTGGPVSLLVVDADHFKGLNDRHGHAVGDEVLKGLARCLSTSVGRPNDLVARVGGEEFAVLLPNTDEEGALRVAQAIHGTVAMLAFGPAGTGAGAVTVSIGLAVAAADGTGGMGDLYRRADAALYEAKAGGRNRTFRAGTPGARADRDKAAA